MSYFGLMSVEVTELGPTDLHSIILTGIFILQTQKGYDCKTLFIGYKICQSTTWLCKSHMYKH